MPLRTPSSLPIRATLKKSTSLSRSTTASPAQVLCQSARQPSTKQTFSSTTVKQGGGSAHHYDPPSGWLWGEPPGSKKPKEGWETSMYIFLAANALLAVGYIFKPDTSIQTWALEEARRRLEAEGILEDSEKKE